MKNTKSCLNVEMFHHHSIVKIYTASKSNANEIVFESNENESDEHYP